MKMTSSEALLHLDRWEADLTEVMALYVSQDSQFHVSGFGRVRTTLSALKVSSADGSFDSEFDLRTRDWAYIEVSECPTSRHNVWGS